MTGEQKGKEQRIDPVVEDVDDEENEDEAENEYHRDYPMSRIRDLHRMMEQLTQQVRDLCPPPPPPPPAAPPPCCAPLRPEPSPVEPDIRVKYLELFLLFRRRLSRPFFDGAMEPTQAERWIYKVKKDLEVLHCPPQYEVPMATYLLDGVADYWWEDVQRRYPQGHAFTWEEFSYEFEKKYYPFLKEEKYLEFIHLEQGNTSVREYEDRFYELLHFIDKSFSAEDLMVWKFQLGLRLSIRIKIELLGLTTFREVVNRAKIAEEGEKAAENALHACHSTHLQRTEPVSESNTGEHAVMSQRQNPARTSRRLRMKFHPDRPCQTNSGACFRCGQSGHLARDCCQPPTECPPRERPNPSPPAAKRPATAARVNPQC